MVGSTLDGGPNWADGGGGFLPPREVYRGVVVALMGGRTSITLPMFSPADVLHMPAGVAGFRRREPAVSDHQLRPVPACVVGQVAPRCAQRRIRQATPAGAGTRQPFLPQHPRRVQTFNNDPAVSFSQSRREDMEVMRADIVDPAMQPGNLGGAGTVLPGSFRAA